ncbi:MAG: hypothetical protein RIC55_17385 [Pirellulaceae bacterium]
MEFLLPGNLGGSQRTTKTLGKYGAIAAGRETVNCFSAVTATMLHGFEDQGGPSARENCAWLEKVATQQSLPPSGDTCELCLLADNPIFVNALRRSEVIARRFRLYFSNIWLSKM